jgi:hypothetical protein
MARAIVATVRAVNMDRMVTERLDVTRGWQVVEDEEFQ